MGTPHLATDNAGYYVLPGRHGIAITGRPPLSHLHGLTKVAQDEGFDESSSELAQALGATYVFVSAASKDAWCDEVKARAKTG
jgi:hypothetical protein